MAAIKKFQTGFRLIAGEALNTIVSAVNNLTGNGTAGPVSATTVTATGNISTTANVTGQSVFAGTGGKIGYATGGAAVTQLTNRTTGVTINNPCGQITTNNASLAAAAFADFVVTNSLVLATDTIVVSIIPGGTGAPVAFVVNVAAGSFSIRVFNQHATTADTSADVINFAVLKSVAA